MIWHCEFQKKDHFWVINISMATHNQMTLILRNLKFILFILFIFQILLSMPLAGATAHIL